VLIYKRRQHLVNVFMWPAQRAAPEDRTVAAHGYHALHWDHGDLTYWAVSDVASDDLGTLAALFQSLP